MIKKYIFSLFVVSFLSITNAWGATLYFDDSGTGDQDWGNIANWWTDNFSTIQAGSLPSVSDDVVIKTMVATNSGAPISIGSLTVNNGAHINDIGITVSSGASFYGNSYSSNSTITWNVTLNDSSANAGTITWDVTFNDSSANAGTITWDVVFNNSSYNNFDINWDVVFNNSSYHSGGIISGLATFNGTSRNEATVASAVFNTVSDGFRSGSGNTMSGVVTGMATFNTGTVNNGSVQIAVFNGQSYNYGDVLGDAEFNDMSINEYDFGSVAWDAVFNDSSQNRNAVSGNAVFNDSSQNGLLVFWNAIFRNTSLNDGTINGNVDVYSPSQNPIGGVVLGTITYHNYNATFPVISSINSTVLFPPGFEVTWTTDVLSTSRVEYGLTDSYGSFSALYISPKTSHTVPVTNLLPFTTYHYRVISVDSTTGNSTTSPDQTFTTSSGGSGMGTPLINEKVEEKAKIEVKVVEEILPEPEPASEDDEQKIEILPPDSESRANTTIYEQKTETATGEQPFGTREETLNIAIKLSGIEVKGVYICQNKFTDTPVPYSCEIAEKAQDANIISKERTTFRPERFITRIEAYSIFMKSICVAPETNENNWKKLIIKRAIELGLTSRTIDTFSPDRAISSAEMFALAQKIGQWKANNPNSCQNK